jgi:uncharacterized protein YqjF (DUF2071 family)
MPSKFLTATWHHLIMANYQVEPKMLLDLVPRGTELDSWNGKHFVSVVGFHFLNTRVLGLPIPWHRKFEEVNLRFYVRRHVGNEVRRGVVFIREIVPKWAIAWVANTVYNERYSAMKMASSDRVVTGSSHSDCSDEVAREIKARAYQNVSLERNLSNDMRSTDGSWAQFRSELHYRALLWLCHAAGWFHDGVSRRTPIVESVGCF